MMVDVMNSIEYRRTCTELEFENFGDLKRGFVV